MELQSFELSKIPSSTIAEWRTPAGLNQAHFASETIPTYSQLHAVAGEYLTLGIPNIQDQIAVSTGIAIAEVAHFREASLGITEFPDVLAANFVVMTLVKKMSGYSDDIEFTKRSVDRTNVNAPRTMHSYERVAGPHVEGNDRQIELAKRGAAFMHSILKDAEDVAKENALADEEHARREAYRAPVISLTERLSLTP